MLFLAGGLAVRAQNGLGRDVERLRLQVDPGLAAAAPFVQVLEALVQAILQEKRFFFYSRGFAAGAYNGYLQISTFYFHHSSSSLSF